jgi:hypothetical protein
VWWLSIGDLLPPKRLFDHNMTYFTTVRWLFDLQMIYFATKCGGFSISDLLPRRSGFSITT